MKSLEKDQEGTEPVTQGVLGTFWRQRRPLFLNMGPVALCVTCVVLIGLMAVLYLSQVGQAVDTNRELQKIHQEQSSLTRQDQDLRDLLAQEQSPGYIIAHAQQQGLQPADPKNTHILFIPGIQPIPDQP